MKGRVTNAKALGPLRQEVRRRGWHHKPTGLVLLQLASHVTMSLGGVAIFILYDEPWVRACAMVVSTAGSMGVATSSHMSSHYASSARSWLNELLVLFGYTFLWGLSSRYWHYKHVEVHHPAPNVIGLDDDADFSPLFALTRKQVREASPGWRFYYQHVQFWVFPLALLFLGISMPGTSWVFLVKALFDRERRTVKHWIDLGVLLLHFAAWIAVPMLYFTPLEVLGFYLLRAAMVGFGVFALSAPGHIPVYAAFIDENEECNDLLMRQTATTANFTTGPLGRWLCSGLEYQIEHHLFPGVSHVYYPQLAPLVQELCRQQNVPYQCYGWDEALWRSFKVLATPKRIEPRLEALRVDAAGGNE